MKVLVCGSRDWTDDIAIYDALHPLRLNDPDFSLITGTKRDEYRLKRGAPQIGADQITHDLAIRLAIPCTVVEPEWKKYGSVAGPLRNSAMLDLCPDLVLAFWQRHSRGTADTIAKARRLGIPVEVHEGQCP